jgi:predicted nuclease of predicted toxin-antitoxin system
MAAMTRSTDEKLHRMADADIFAKARVEARVVLTFDLDFGEIVAATREANASVVVFRLKDTRADQVTGRATDSPHPWSGLRRGASKGLLDAELR